MTPEFLAAIRPVVLVGGKSRRFGRDKLREPVGDGVLVQRPIGALRAVFGRRVMLVGECGAGVAALGDGVIADEHPGVGPIGGIASALRACGAPVFVLAGDMPAFAPEDVRRICEAFAGAPGALAVLGADARVHACAGIYTPAAGPVLQARIASGDYRLGAALPEAAVVRVPCGAASLRNVNVPADLR